FEFLLTIMDDSALGVNSLYDLTIQQICQSMDENTLVYVLKSFHPAMSLDIVWKMLHVNDDNKDFEYKHTLPYEHKNYSQMILSMNRGNKLATLNPDVETNADVQFYENQLKFADNQQVLLLEFS
ncbi:amyloid protein-binding protein 2, partial [Aphis craccivora]